MANFMIIKTLGGAVLLRTWETYKLLFTRFWWLVGLAGAMVYMIPQTYTVLAALLIIKSVVLLLSRSSMVQKNWRYVMTSDKTVGVLVWNMCDASLFLLQWYLPLVARIAYAMVFIPFKVFWVFYFLDTKITLRTIVGNLVRSGYKAVQALWVHPGIFLATLFTIFIELELFLLLLLHWNMPALIIIIMFTLVFPLFAAFIAVLYEHMRYRTEVQ